MLQRNLLLEISKHLLSFLQFPNTNDGLRTSSNVKYQHTSEAA